MTTCYYHRQCADFKYHSFKCDLLYMRCPHYKIFDDYATGKRDRLEIIRELEKGVKEPK